MLRSRVIPCLLLHEGGLVKTQNFKAPRYLGDPLNAVKIFNEKQADELIVLDIDASVKGVSPNFDLIAKLAAECRMPLCYGGGITSADQASRLVAMGVEKVAVSSAAINSPGLLTDIASAVGRQSVVAVLDVRKKRGLLAKGYEACTHNARKVIEQAPLVMAKQLQDAGAGEIMINFIDRDGLMIGYDIQYAQQIKKMLKVPVTFLGGAGSLEHMSELMAKLGVVGAAAGSLFVFKGKYNAVLINYPLLSQKVQLCNSALKF